MNTADTLSRAVQTQALAWSRRGYGFAMVATVAVLALTAPSLAEAAVTLPSIAAAWALLTLRRVPRGLLSATCALGGATLVWAVATGGSVVASAGVSIGVAVWISRRSARPLLASSAAWVAVTAVSAIALATVPDVGLRTLLFLSLTSAAWIASVVDVEGPTRLLRLLEQAKDAEREVSLLQERERFAADLHDVLGHSLHVVKLKAAVAERMVRTDPEAAVREVAAIQAIAGDAVARGRELARATHRFDLRTELHNAALLLRAAGIATTVEHEGEDHFADGLDRDQHRALVLREATTNILRHAQATTAVIRIGHARVEVENNGAGPHPDGQPRLRGLATLGRRVSDQGGTLSVRTDQGWFRVVATFDDGTVA